MFHQIQVRSTRRAELIDITRKVRDLVREQKIEEGVCFLFLPHTTAGILINENADPSVAQDILSELEQLVPWDAPYQHGEGNAAAHIKSCLIGPSKIVFIDRGELVLGTWQGIFLAEFDGPRQRKVWIKLVPTEK
jgi:secondary thiamine-phosphate synthase enzyme